MRVCFALWGVLVCFVLMGCDNRVSYQSTTTDESGTEADPGPEKDDLVQEDEPADPPDTEIDVENNDSPQPESSCLRFEKEILDFGEPAFGESRSQIFTITNCSSSEPAFLEEASLSEGSEETWVVRVLGREIPPGESTRLEVIFVASGQKERGMLDLLVSRGEESFPWSVELKANVSACPLAGIESSERAGPIASGPQEFVFSGSRSFDPGAEEAPDRGIARYVWSFASFPGDVEPEFVPDGESPEVAFLPQRIGAYAVELRVFDKEGVESCEPARVEFTVERARDPVLEGLVDTPGLAIRLLWDTHGTDMDLHFLHAGYGTRWDASPWDCYWRNNTPNWGDPARIDDNPSLDIDDVRGVGPEITSLDILEEGVEYRVGVHYFSDHGNGSSFASVEIFFGGELLYAESEVELEYGDFWEVARLSFNASTRELEIENSPVEIREGFPDQIGD